MKKLILGAMFAISMGLSINASAQYTKIEINRVGPANVPYVYVQLIVNGSYLELHCYEQNGSRVCAWTVDDPTNDPTIVSDDFPNGIKATDLQATADQKIASGTNCGETNIGDIYLQWCYDPSSQTYSVKAKVD